MEMDQKQPIELIFTVGLPASGKSTWSKEFVKQWNNRDKWIRVCRDDLRLMRGEYWIPDQEKLITDWEYECVAWAIRRKYNVIVDATNLHDKTRRKLLDYLHRECRLDFHWTIKDFTNVSVEECIRRDNLRTEGRVGENVILEMAMKAGMIKPPLEPEYDINKPHCIIVDIDGTLAHNYQGRSFYDWDRVRDDTLDGTIAMILNDYLQQVNRRVIVVSGRDGVAYGDTHKWLEDNKVTFNKLLMRSQGDTRPDEIVKREIYEEHIKPLYNVDFVLDDRNKVVKMWRSLGLKVLQVAEGNF